MSEELPTGIVQRELNDRRNRDKDEPSFKDAFISFVAGSLGEKPDKAAAEKQQQHSATDAFAAEHGIWEEAGLKHGLIGFIGGTLGGVAGVYVGQPLDTVKVKMQAFPTLYTNMFTCLKETYVKDGIWRGLYAGTIPAVIANVAENSVLFACYGTIQKMAAKIVGVKSTHDLPHYASACCGSFAGIFCALTLCPTELIKCKLQAMRETGQKRDLGGGKKVPWTPYTLTADILKKEGVLGFYRGMPPTMVREMFGFFFFFGGYEMTRSFFVKEGQTVDDIGVFKTMVAGGVGGVTLWTVIFPFDVVKSRIQIQGSDASFIDIMKDIYRKEGGIKPFFSGLGPTWVRTFPATGVLFVVYEWTKKFLHSAFP